MIDRLKKEACYWIRLSSSGRIIHSADGAIIERTNRGRQRLIELRYEYIEQRKKELDYIEAH